MANIGRFVDRNPDIKFAGVQSNPNETLFASFHFYDTREAAEYMMQKRCKEKQSGGQLFKRTPIVPTENVQTLLSTDLSKSRFLSFKEKFSEDMYFKKPNLGKALKTNSKPDDVTNESQVFGCASYKSDSLYDVVLPNKSCADVNSEFHKWHDKYVISHRHYFPSEQVNRHYNERFDRNAVYGRPMNIDDSGRFVRRCLQQCDDLMVTSKFQMDFIDRTVPPLGRRLKKYCYDISENTIFGHPSNLASCDAKMLVENIDPCIKNTELIQAMAHLIRLRRMLFDNSDFHIHDLLTLFEEKDENNTGYLPLKTILEVAQKLYIRIEADKMRMSLKHFEMLVDEDQPTERVNYKKFCQLLKIQVPLPKTGNMSPAPVEVFNKDTTYRRLCEDLQRPRHELPVPSQRALARIDEKTTAADLISPSIPTHFGLLPSDFSKPRSKAELRRIFERLIIEDDVFEALWIFAKIKSKLTKDEMSINQLDNVTTFIASLF